jgi:hypothetical protein
MSSVLVWSVESVLLGLWALVFSAYSTPLHVFVARSHLIISSFTLVLQLYVKARGLVVGPGISHAFVCAVSALFLVYISFLCAENSMTRFFKMPSVGWLTLDACIGLAWFIVAFISSVGMALSFVKRDSAGRVTCSLMFHSYGAHLVIVLPCLSVLLGLGGLYGTGMCIIFVLVWVLYIFLLGVKIFIGSVPFQERGLDFWALSVAEKFSYVFLEICTRVFLIFVSGISLLTPNISGEQRLLVFILFVVSIVMVLDIFYIPYFIFGNMFNLPKLPTLDAFFGPEWERNHTGDMINPPGSVSNPNVSQPLIPVNSAVPSAPPPVGAVQSQAIFQSPQLPHLSVSSRFNLSASAQLDPAAVSISRRHLVDAREKHV